MSDAPGVSFPYRRVAEGLRAAIDSGELTAGDRLPSEWALAERYHTTRPTVRRAVAALKAEGLVVTEQGRGTFVRPRPPVQLSVTGGNYRRHRRARRPGFDAQVAEQGGRPEQRLLQVGSEPATAVVASRLGVEEGVRVVVRRRVFLVDGQPVARCDSYYRADLAGGTVLERPGRIPGGALSVVEDPEGPIRRSADHSVDELSSRMPTRQEAEMLGLAPGVPVVRILRTIYDESGETLEVQETVAAADRHEFRYEVDMR